jgi:hypothetical protein
VRRLICFSAFAAALSLAATIGFAGDDTGKKADMQPQFGPPPQIKELDFMVGDWIYKGKMRMGPDAEWVEHEAKVKFSSVAGGGAIQMEYAGMMMGMEMHGLGLTAFDRELNEWQDTWIDNFSGRISFYTGKYEKDRRRVSGKDMMGGQTVHSRATTYDITDTEFKWMMESSMDGENWYVSMDGVYTRKN